MYYLWEWELKMTTICYPLIVTVLFTHLYTFDSCNAAPTVLWGKIGITASLLVSQTRRINNTLLPHTVDTNDFPWTPTGFVFLSLSTFLPPGILPSSLDGKKFMWSSKLSFSTCVCAFAPCCCFRFVLHAHLSLLLITYACIVILSPMKPPICIKTWMRVHSRINDWSWHFACSLLLFLRLQQGLQSCGDTPLLETFLICLPTHYLDLTSTA